MSDNINLVQFPGRDRPKRKPEPEVISAIESMLEQARAGEIVGLMAATTSADNSVSRWDFGEHMSYSTIGALHMCIHSIQESAPEEKV